MARTASPDTSPAVPIAGTGTASGATAGTAAAFFVVLRGAVVFFDAAGAAFFAAFAGAAFLVVLRGVVVFFATGAAGTAFSGPGSSVVIVSPSSSVRSGPFGSLTRR